MRRASALRHESEHPTRTVRRGHPGGAAQALCSMNPNTPGADDGDAPDALDELAGEYVLGTLSAARRREVERRLPAEDALREAVQRWQERLLPLAALAGAAEPSARLWRRIEDTLERQSPAQAAASPARAAASADAAGDAASGASPEGLPGAAPASLPPRALPSAPRAAPKAAAPGAGWWNSLKLWRGLAGSGFAAAAVLAAVLVMRLGAPPAAPQYLVVLVAPQDKAPGWVVQAAGARQLSLIPLGQAAVPAEKSLQFWTKGEGWAGPVSLGLVKPGQTLRVALDRLPPLQPNQLFELTLEPASGSPINRPTGPIQFIGRAVKVL